MDTLTPPLHTSEEDGTEEEQTQQQEYGEEYGEEYRHGQDQVWNRHGQWGVFLGVVPFSPWNICLYSAAPI